MEQPSPEHPLEGNKTLNFQHQFLHSNDAICLRLEAPCKGVYQFKKFKQKNLNELEEAQELHNQNQDKDKSFTYILQTPKIFLPMAPCHMYFVND